MSHRYNLDSLVRRAVRFYSRSVIDIGDVGERFKDVHRTSEDQVDDKWMRSKSTSLGELDSHESSLLSQDKPHPSHHRLLLSGVICGISGDMNSETHGYIDTPHMSLTSGVESIGCAIEHLSKDVERSQDDFYVWGLYGNVIGDWINKGIVGWVGREVVWYKSTIADMVASKSVGKVGASRTGAMELLVYREEAALTDSQLGNTELLSSVETQGGGVVGRLDVGIEGIGGLGIGGLGMDFDVGVVRW
ncbi:hypothetical protein Tco_0486482 [Tanacetum coccineum]